MHKLRALGHMLGSIVILYTKLMPDLNYQQVFRAHDLYSPTPPLWPTISESFLRPDWDAFNRAYGLG